MPLCSVCDNRFSHERIVLLILVIRLRSREMTTGLRVQGERDWADGAGKDECADNLINTYEAELPVTVIRVFYSGLIGLETGKTW